NTAVGAVEQPPLAVEGKAMVVDVRPIAIPSRADVIPAEAEVGAFQHLALPGEVDVEEVVRIHGQGGVKPALIPHVVDGGRNAGPAEAAVAGTHDSEQGAERRTSRCSRAGDS